MGEEYVARRIQMHRSHARHAFVRIRSWSNMDACVFNVFEPVGIFAQANEFVSRQSTHKYRVLRTYKYVVFRQ